MQIVEISDNNTLLGVVCIDAKQNDMGYIAIDNDLDSLLDIIVDMPYLMVDVLISTDCFAKEKIYLTDSRYIGVLNVILSDYALKIKNSDESITKILTEYQTMIG